MPVIVAIDHHRRQVNVVAVGPVTLDDAFNQLEHEVRGGSLAYPKFVDVRGAGVLITPEENRQVAERMLDYNRQAPLGPMAFVVSTDAAAKAIGALVDLVGGAFPIRVFRDEIEAHEWLRSPGRGEDPSTPGGLPSDAPG